MLSKTKILVLCAGALLLLMGIVQNSSIFAQGGPEFRRYDGSGNNLNNPDIGSTNTQLLRLANAAYEDGLSEPRGGGINNNQSLPSARAISNQVSAQAGLTSNALGASDYLWQWGQFLDHDIDLTSAATPTEAFPIAVPTGDPFFDPNSTGTAEIGLRRSIFDANTGTSNARQQINQITAWIDASQVYGSDQGRADWKREFVGGRLNISDGNLLPFEPEDCPETGGPCFGAGDVRVNEQIALTAMHTLFMREHNRLAARIAAANPALTDEEIYQRARALVGAQIQLITYNEFLTVLLGPNALPGYTGYNAQVDGRISQEFSTAAYRVGHTMLPSTLLRLDANGQELANGHVPLRNAFFNPQWVIDDGIEPILRGLAVEQAQAIDPLIIDDVRNFLFGPPGSGGFDLASLNIQRGRDHGLPSYNALRQALGLGAVNSFADITSNAAFQNALANAYQNDVNQVDLWIGGLAEDHINGGTLGETFYTIIVDQFTRLRDADRFWHQNVDWTTYGFEAEPVVHDDGTILTQLKLSDIIGWNTTFTNPQENLFFAAPISSPTEVLYVSSNTTGNIGGLSAADEDILRYDANSNSRSPWALHFDGSDLLPTSDVNAFYLLTDGSLLMSFDVNVTLPNLGTVNPQDIVRFIPSSTGETTEGQFEWYLDGSDVELTTSNEGIDAIAKAPDGRLLISTIGSGTVTGVPSFTDADIIAFTPNQTGSTTSGTWEMYFDGSDVGLTSSTEDISALWVDSNSGEIYLTTLAAFGVEGLTGTAEDIFICLPAALGDVTGCASFEMFFDGSEQGVVAGHVVDAFSVVFNGAKPILYLSTIADTTVAQVSFAGEDIMGLNRQTGLWELYFDGSDMGSSINLNAFLVLTDSILMSFEGTVTLPDVGSVLAQDIVRFVPTSTGERTNGRFEWYLDGSDVELTTSGENIDAIGMAPDGRLLISIIIDGSVTNVASFWDEDLIAFTPTSLGETSSGSWQMYFDGSDVNLTNSVEDIAGVWVDSETDEIHLTTYGAFAVVDLTGDGTDIFTCAPFSLGNTTICGFDNIFFDGSEQGYPSAHIIDGFSLAPDITLSPSVPTIPEQLYLSSNVSGIVGGVSATDEDIVVYDGEIDQWDLHLDFSDLGITGDVNAFLREDDGTVLVSFDGNTTLPGLGAVTPHDIVRFVPSNTGLITLGHFEWYFDGSDVDLTTTSEYIDAFAIAPDGRLLISTNGSGAVTGVASFTHADLLAFTATELGEASSGTWQLYFQGADVNLTSSTENIVGLWVNSENGHLYLSTSGAFSVLELSGTGEDIFVCEPFSLGYTTICGLEMFFDGSEEGIIANHIVDGMSLAFNENVSTLYLSLAAATTSVDQVAFNREDILLYDGQSDRWSLYFDGSDVVGTVDVNAFLVLTDSILLSFNGSPTLPGVGTITPQDVVRFVHTSIGETTEGQFEWYLDGSDVELTTSAENIDALGLLPDGRILISTSSTAFVTGLSFAYHDIIAFTPTQLGETTIGTWQQYFDGSDVALTTSYENVWGTWIDEATGDTYLTTNSSFAVAGVSGDNRDIFICEAGVRGDVTACSFEMFWDGSAEGFAYGVDGFSLQRSEEPASCYTLTTNAIPAIGGTISLNPTPNCAGGTYQEGTVVTLTASPNAGYTFSHWSANASGNNTTTTVTMNSNQVATANFNLTPNCHTLTSTPSPNNGGTIEVAPAPNCAGGTYQPGTVVTLMAHPNADYSFNGWSGDATGTTTMIMVTMDGNKSVTATFDNDPQEGGVVVLAIEPASVSTGIGQTFDVTIMIQADTQQVDGAMAHLNFDPAVLEVANITPGAAFPLELQNQFDNSNGTLDVTVGTINNFPSGTIVVATVTFTALAESNATIIQFNEAAPRESRVTFAGNSVLDHTESGTVIVQAGSVVLSTSPVSVTTSVGQSFDLEIMVEADTQQVDGGMALLNFSPAILQVVSITPGNTLPLELQNTFNNTDGTVDYSAGTVNNFPSGTFLLATVRLTAIAPSDRTLIEFNHTEPRRSRATFGGQDVLGGTVGSTLLVNNSIINGSVTLQGRPNPPHQRWSVPLTVAFCNPGNPTPIQTFSPTTDENGSFSLTGVALGNGNVSVKHEHTLRNGQNVTVVAGINNLNLGTLREGDANNDNAINLLDFSSLASTFAKCEGTAGFDERADFNEDGCINLLDFSLLASNFAQIGDNTCVAAAAAAPNHQPERAEEGANVAIAIEPAQTSVKPGETFTITLVTRAGEQTVDGIHSALNFDPQLLEVVQVRQGETLPQELLNQFDNQNGTIDVAAGALENLPTGTIELVQLQFRALQAGESALSFQFEAPRQTNITFGGSSIFGEHTNGVVTISEPTAVTVIEFGKREGSPLPVGALGALAMTMLAGAFIMRRRWQN
jgi:hypothetical protein